MIGCFRMGCVCVGLAGLLTFWVWGLVCFGLGLVCWFNISIWFLVLLGFGGLFEWPLDSGFWCFIRIVLGLP